MATPNKIHQDVMYYGAVKYLSTLEMPNNSITSDMISTTDPIVSTKLQRRIAHKYFQDGTIADDQEGMHIVYGSTGILVGFECCITETAIVGDSTVNVDLWLNGSTILTGTVNFTSAHAVRTVLTATFSALPLADDDVLEVEVDATVSSGTLPVGLLCILTHDEDAA